MVLPGLFSTTTGWPQRSDRCWPTSRPEMSSGPPGGKGTTIRTGFDGKSCPELVEGAQTAVAAARKATKIAMARFIAADYMGKPLAALPSAWRKAVALA